MLNLFKRRDDHAEYGLSDDEQDRFAQIELMMKRAFSSPIPEALASQVVTSDKTGEIFSALSKAQGAVEKARRSKKGVDNINRTSWEYAGLDDVLDAVKQARADNGLAIIERFPAGKAALHAILIHASGQWIDYGTYAFGDYKTQNEKSEVITRARRHFLKCIFGVVDQAEDRDEPTANTRTFAGESMDEPLVDDAGGKAEPKPSAKNLWRIECEITDDGRLDLDTFAADYETALHKVKSMSDLSFLSKANNLTLAKMQEERPELFAHIQDITSPIAQKLL